MKKRLAVILLPFILIAAFGISVCAEKTYFVDEAGIVSPEDNTLLNQKLAYISNQLGFDVVIVTVRTVNGQDPERFTENYYDSHGYGVGEKNDGVILLLNMGERDWVITSTGFGKEAVNEEAREYLADTILGDLKDGKYARAFRTFADEVAPIVKNAQKGNYYKKPFLSTGRIVITAVISLIVGGVSVSVMSAGLKTVAPQKAAASYVVDGSMDVRLSRDHFLYRTVSRTEKPKPSSSSGSGGGSNHSSSSGKF